MAVLHMARQQCKKTWFCNQILCKPQSAHLVPKRIAVDHDFVIMSFDFVCLICIRASAVHFVRDMLMWTKAVSAHLVVKSQEFISVPIQLHEELGTGSMTSSYVKGAFAKSQYKLHAELATSNVDERNLSDERIQSTRNGNMSYYKAVHICS